MCTQMLMHAVVHRGVWTLWESLHWKLILGEKSCVAPGNQICFSGLPVWCSTNWATPPPAVFLLYMWEKKRHHWIRINSSLLKKWPDFCIGVMNIIVALQDIPLQMNGSDCGMFSCMYAESITRGAEITFSQVPGSGALSWEFYVIIVPFRNCSVF